MLCILIPCLGFGPSGYFHAHGLDPWANDIQHFNRLLLGLLNYTG